VALHRRGGESRVYRVHLDHLGRATLIFGDGLSGARLPSGRDNVVATYRTGMSSRSVAAGGLSLLATRPLGLDAVANPMPSTPGAPAESREEIRFRAPRKLYTLGRIVSLKDFADFALEYPGVDKAGAWGMTAGGSRAVQITLAAPGGVPIPEGSALIRDLLDAIQRNRAFDSPVTIQSYRPVRVLVAARVQVAPGFLWDDVRKDILAAVADEFGFTRARFGGGVSAAAVVSAMQGVRGVQAVDLDSFSWAGRDDGRDDGRDGDAEPRERRAAPPSLDPVSGEILPAELVLLDPPELTGPGAP
jgi:predicted phage baseplate assembly protein